MLLASNKTSLLMTSIFISKFVVFKKFISASKEDTNHFLCLKKFRSTFKEDINKFLCFEKDLLMSRFLKLKG